jgi:DNA adenine methylase
VPATVTRPAPGFPILKWVGGKTRLLDRITAEYGGQHQVVEPFFGGGALSFHLAAARPGLHVVANDALTPLIAIYTAVRDDVESFITAVDAHATPYLSCTGKDARRRFYYDVRDRYMRAEIDGPAPLFFLLWCAYSGMYRTGKTYPGRFNTPHGFGKEQADFYHPERLRLTAPHMAGWNLHAGDFAQVIDAVDADSFVFLDPPYRDTYTGYTDDGFSAADQLRVVTFAHTAAQQGARVVYTNKDTGDGFYNEHFNGWVIDRVPIRYSVNRNCTTVGRPLSHEVFITNRPSRTRP